MDGEQSVTQIETIKPNLATHCTSPPSDPTKTCNCPKVSAYPKSTATQK